MWTQPQLRAFRAARDACIAVKPIQEFATQLAAKFPEFQPKLDELNAATDYVETVAGMALATVGE